MIKQYRLTIDPEWVRFSFPVDSQKTVLVRCRFSAQGVGTPSPFARPGSIRRPKPSLLSPQDPRYTEVLDYLRYLTDYYSLNAVFKTDGDEIVRPVALNRRRSRDLAARLVLLRRSELAVGATLMGGPYPPVAAGVRGENHDPQLNPAP